MSGKRTYRYWSAEEDDLLLKSWPTTSREELARLLRRSFVACRDRASALRRQGAEVPSRVPPGKKVTWVKKGIRAGLLRQFVDAGRIATGKSRTGDSLSVLVFRLRRAGFEVITEWGVGYRMEPAERKRLRASAFFARSAAEDPDGALGIVVSVPRESYDALKGMSEETGEPFEMLASKVFEAGLDEVLQ